MSSREDQITIKLYTEADSPTGVDDFLLLDQLRLTPEQRLDQAERRMAEALKLTRGARRVADPSR